MPKMVGFRPSEKTDNAIALLIKQKKAKNKSDAVNQLIELAIKLEASQLEHPNGKKATGTLIQCPLRTVPVPYDKPFITWKAPVDTSVCKSCSKYPCESWEILQSYERITTP